MAAAINEPTCVLIDDEDHADADLVDDGDVEMSGPTGAPATPATAAPEQAAPGPRQPGAAAPAAPPAPPPQSRGPAQGSLTADDIAEAFEIATRPRLEAALRQAQASGHAPTSRQGAAPSGPPDRG
eukprot:14411306-Alexandrium_andersonii.AAC.1